MSGTAQTVSSIHHIRFNVPDEKTLTAYLHTKGIGKT